MTPELLASIAAIIISLCASYIPWFSTWFEALDTVIKRLVMLVLLLAISISAFTLTCAGYGAALNLSITCDTSGALSLFRIFLAALLANQATYQLTKPSTSNALAKIAAATDSLSKIADAVKARTTGTKK